MRQEVICQSGLRGWRDFLQNNYESFEEFEAYADTYGLLERLGYEDAQTAWDENPLVEGSVRPSDFRRADESAV